jgi:hemoglobin
MGGSLYERLGGRDAIAAVVEDFVARCAADDRINRKFARTDIARLKQNMVDWIVELGGGPGTYAGRDMRTTHQGMAVTGGEYDALIENLETSLDRFGVGEAEKAELTGPEARLRTEIVEVESPETGTDLPSGYQNAPPLAASGAGGRPTARPACDDRRGASLGPTLHPSRPPRGGSRLAPLWVVPSPSAPRR